MDQGMSQADAIGKLDLCGAKEAWGGLGYQQACTIETALVKDI